jgi:hypothetical protein
MTLALATAAMIPASASAGVTPAPGTLDFINQQVGATSDSKLVHVHVDCEVIILGDCAYPGSLTADPVFSGANPGDFAQTNDCGAVFTSETFDYCSFLITFKPTAPGARAATLTLGTAGSEVSGTYEVAVALTGTATPEPVMTPTPPATETTPATAAAKKKCKKAKKGAGAAKKKCKKKGRR